MENDVVELCSLRFAKAQILKTRLESEGIECFLANINLVQSDISAGVRVFVKSAGLKDALKVRAAMDVESGSDQELELQSAKQIRRILVPVDYSDNSLKACLFALGLANELKAELRLIHACYNPAAYAAPFSESFAYQGNLDHYMKEIEENVKREMHSLIQQLREEAAKRHYQNIRLSESVITGIPEDAIFEAVEYFKPGVVVMGTTGKGGRLHTLLGSVTEKVINRSPVPVLVIPCNADTDNLTSIHNLAYATGFEESDISALQKLMSILAPFRFKIFCVHVVDRTPGNWDIAHMEFLKESITDKYGGLMVRCDLMEDEDIIEGLEKYIDGNAIDIIALTTHRRGLLARLFEPGITSRLLMHSRIPILIFHTLPTS